MAKEALAITLGDGRRHISVRPSDATDPLTLVAERFAPRNTDAFERWCKGRLGTWLTPPQLRISESITNHRYTAVPSCHSAGKSRIAAMLMGHFIDSHPLGSAFAVSTAPSSGQVESVLWRELNRIHAQSGLRGRITRSGYPQWHIGDELVAFGRKPKEMASFQGVHAKFLLIIIEEADGIPEELWIAVDTLTSSGNVRVLAIGNPDSADSHFAKVVKASSDWNVVPIDGLRTPNFTRKAVRKFPDLAQYMEDNHIPYADASVQNFPENVRAEWRENLLNPTWVAERMHRWGVVRIVDEQTKKVRWRESSLWYSKVRGRPPTEGSEGIIPLAWVERAQRRWYEWHANGEPKQLGRRILGCDVADTGKDETVMPIRQGQVIEHLNRVGQQDTETTVERLAGQLRTVVGTIACVDAGGMGVAIFNRLRKLRLPVIGYVGAASAMGARDRTGEFTFANVRSAAYWHLRELLDPINGPDELALPPDEDLVTDLTVPLWKIKTGAIIVVEPKESVTKKLKRSPDCGDAVVMCCWPSSSAVTERRIYEYAMEQGQFDEWAPTPHRSPSHRRARRLVELGQRGRPEPVSRSGTRIHSYTESGGRWEP